MTLAALILVTSIASGIVSSQASITIDAGNKTGLGFSVDYENNQFLLDGTPFRYVSGSFHYFRAPRVYWRDIFRKMRAAGLNAVSTYVEWSLHEPEKGRWEWSGEADLEYFLTLAQEEDLFVILRPGPYICAERDFGGLPFWLLSLAPDIRLRTSDTRYMEHVTDYINALMTRVGPFLRGNGGPVIMVQVENEYGSFDACDLGYMSQVRDLMSRHVGNDALLYTTDGDTADMLRCGMVPEVYTTVDFGTSSNVTRAFATMRLFQPRGPLVNSEFYCGWLTHWEESYSKVTRRSVASKLDEILRLGASVNLYMFYGGTNFGFTSGANTSPNYQPQLTSYDYDAPIREDGVLTKKYFDIKKVVERYLPIPNITLAPASLKGDYGAVAMERVIRLFDSLARSLLGRQKRNANEPPTFESFGIPLAMVLYETDLPENRTDPSVLTAGFLHDRALVYQGDRLIGTLSRTHNARTLSLPDPYAKRLKILVENQGHVNYGNKIHDFKGVGNVTINGLPLAKWNATGFHLGDVSPLLGRTAGVAAAAETKGLSDHGPVFLRGTFTVYDDPPLDTFLDTTGWGKGIAYINGRNLGRYWPAAGPQMTLYVPAPFLQNGENELIVLELENLRVPREFKFSTRPN
ncbi:beta-galactosidase [Athalia rosae]|uniref:beta-galactosidase n=1 Tax=Athalia rosae TaxID=37344 RepID=UPI002033F1B4|nr:beta-galactosidase [Athalia rosae]